MGLPGKITAQGSAVRSIVEIGRELAAAHPDRHRPDLATAPTSPTP
jgi:hypothetical protein